MKIAVPEEFLTLVEEALHGLDLADQVTKGFFLQNYTEARETKEKLERSLKEIKSAHRNSPPADEDELFRTVGHAVRLRMALGLWWFAWEHAESCSNGLGCGVTHNLMKRAERITWDLICDRSKDKYAKEAEKVRKAIEDEGGKADAGTKP